jgi:Carboxypeptidase regulatory-like domain/TonB dependent receptor
MLNPFTRFLGGVQVMHRFLSICCLFAFAFLLSTTHAFGQGTDLGTVRGTVTDSAGAIIPGASVTITDTSTGALRATTTNGQGNYEMFGLKSGTYTVTITAAGMSELQIKDVIINGSDVVSADGQLKISQGKESVTVSSEAVSIDTEDQTISETISSTAITELPRDSRDVYSFLYLNPNITQGSADGEFKFLGAQSYGASFSLDGQRSNGGIFGEPTQSKPSLEAVGEVNILTSDFSAEYAGIANVRVSTKRGGSEYHGSMFYNNKNSALAAWTLDDLNGKANFAPTAFQSKYPNPYFNENDLGGSIGGKIPKLGKTWFFAAYERDYNVAPVKLQSNTVAHPDLYTGNFTQISDDAKPLVPDATLAKMTPTEIATDTFDAGNGDGTRKFVQIPQRLLNPTTQALINNYFPQIGLSAPIDPDTGRIPGGYQTILPGNSTLDSGVLRIDHDFSDRDHLYGVYDASAQTSAQNPVVNPYPGLGLTQVNRRNDTLSLSYTRSISTSLINEVRGGFNREHLLQHSNTTLESFLSSIGFTQADIDAYGAATGAFALSTFGHPSVSFSNTFATFTNGGRNTFRPLDQNLITYGDTLTWIKGKHAFRMGGDMVYNEAQDGFALNRNNVRGAVIYGGSGLTPFTNFLLGNPGTSVSTVSNPRPAMDVHNWESGFFFQDTWKLSNRITLNLGLRYELITPFIDKNDLIANFDPDFVDPTTGQLGRFVIPSNKTLQFLDSRIINFGYVLAGDSGLDVGRGVVRTDKNDWSPRVGIAWRIGNKSVIRGGYGIYYPTSAAQGIRDPIATNPFNQGITTKGTDPWPGNGVDGTSPLSGGTVSATGNTPSVNVVPFGIHQPRIHQYNVTYEREIGWDSVIRVSYLGSTMHGLIAGKDLNQIAPSNTPFGVTATDEDGNLLPGQICDPTQFNCGMSPADAARYRFPALGDFVLSYGNYGHAQSNAFQTQFERHYKHGLLLNLAYTYLDQKSSALDTGNSSLGGIAYDSQNPDQDYGIDGYTSKHRFVAYGVWDLPVGRRRQYGANMRGWEDAIIGGWSTTFNMFAKSGTGFTPFWICDDCNPVEPGNIGISSVDAVGDFNAEPSYRPTVLNNSYNKKTGDSIWNAAAFGLPSVGADVFSNPANAKRNLLYGPGTWGVNLGVHKDFHFGERWTAQIGADVDNVFNHPLFSPDSDSGGGGGSFALLGDFNIRVNPTTGALLPIGQGHPEDIIPNPDFGRLINSFSQEGVDSRRTVRLRLRITF